ncbi:MAG: M23 family metallopeptidase [Rhodospirillales bacterium]|nr:MAG: M23 family metallopeptidase [Rhodospirillales bacterium]
MGERVRVRGGDGGRFHFALVAILLTSSPALAEVRLTGPIEQGALVLGETAPGSRIQLDGVPVMVGTDGRFALGFGREAGPRAELTVEEPGQPLQRLALTVSARSWDIQRIDGLPEKQVTPDPQTLERIKRENERIAQARAKSFPNALFADGFLLPSEGQISGVFGSQRILNGQPRSPHSGVDLAAPVGAPVLAAADGLVVLAEPDLFYTGLTVLIDHGLGVNTVYAHLSAIGVAPGQRVAKGQAIGKVGASGRVTGAHLHWGLSVGQVKLDPMSALKVSPPPPAARP